MEEQILKDSEIKQEEMTEDADEITSKAKPALFALVALGAVYFVLMTVSMVMSVQAGGYQTGAGDVVMYYYQYNGLIVLAALLFSICALAGGTKKAIPVKTFAWGVALAAVVMAAPVFSQLYMLPQVDALTGFNFLVMYIPMLCVAAAFVGLLGAWHSENRKTAGKVALVAAVAAAGITVYYSANVIDPATQYEAFQYLQLGGILCADALMVLLCAVAGYMCVKKEAFDAAAGIGSAGKTAEKKEMFENSGKDDHAFQELVETKTR